jgi:polyphosphate kinase
MSMPMKESLKQLSPAVPALDAPSLYINREISLLQFNYRVLEEALDASQPLLERVKFLSIFASNLDEFFMIRVSGLIRQVKEGVLSAPPDGMSPLEQLATIRQTLTAHLAGQESCWHEDLLPKLRDHGIHICTYDALSSAEHDALRSKFEREIFPALTPWAVDAVHPFPHISNLSLNLAVIVKNDTHGERFARLKIPAMFPRLIPIPDEQRPDADAHLSPSAPSVARFVWIEDLVAANLDMLFPGLDIVASYPFRLARDADLEIKDDEASDLLTTLEKQIHQHHTGDRTSDLLTTMEKQVRIGGSRYFGSAVRLETTDKTPAHIRELLSRNLELDHDLTPYQVYTGYGPLGLADLMELTQLDKPALKYPPFLPTLPAQFNSQESMFDIIRWNDILLYHPYDSFNPVVDFVQEAAHDPQVLAIKMTLYRVGSNSPIVQALKEAQENGKQVAVLLELKARFDEENNIVWARALEDVGVHVRYAVIGLKTHAKMCLVIRKEADGMQRYMHMGTGNYNPLTGRLYTDLSFFTYDPALGADCSDLFNALTGYSLKTTYRKLVVAPWMRQALIQRIDREIRRHNEHGDGYIAFKMNSLVDPQCIQALYRASQAGVNIDLQVRGICCLRPGLPGVSETISVTSIVGRFLEHARIYYFRNGEQHEVLVGSADLMQRNLDRRVEILFPIENTYLRDRIINDILAVQRQDNVQARRLLGDGRYERLSASSDMPPLSSQSWLLTNWRGQMSSTT